MNRTSFGKLSHSKFMLSISIKKTRIKKTIKKPKRYYPIGTIHMCFTVKNINHIYKKLKRNKIKFFSPPLSSDYDNVKTCFCYDPDFNLVQFVEGKQIRKK